MLKPERPFTFPTWTNVFQYRFYVLYTVSVGANIRPAWQWQHSGSGNALNHASQIIDLISEVKWEQTKEFIKNGEFSNAWLWTFAYSSVFLVMSALLVAYQG